jgi:hypothetical protein
MSLVLFLLIFPLLQATKIENITNTTCFIFILNKLPNPQNFKTINQIQGHSNAAIQEVFYCSCSVKTAAGTQDQILL